MMIITRGIVKANLLIIRTDPMNVKMHVKEYYVQLYSHKVDNLDEIDQSLERYNLPKFTQEGISSLKRTISIKEFESRTNNSPK